MEGRPTQWLAPRILLGSWSGTDSPQILPALLSSANLSVFVTLNDLFFKVASQGKLSGINYCRALNQLFTEMEQNQDAVHKVRKLISAFL